MDEPRWPNKEKRKKKGVCRLDQLFASVEKTAAAEMHAEWLVLIVRR